MNTYDKIEVGQLFSIFWFISGLIIISIDYLFSIFEFDLPERVILLLPSAIFYIFTNELKKRY